MARVLVPLAAGCEELEAVTVIDLLRRAGIDVVCAGLEDGPVSASRGVVLLPDTTLDAVLKEHFDMVVLPGGGQGAERLATDHRVLKLLQSMAQSGHYTAAICAAPKALARAGLLRGKRATSYPGVLEAEECDARLSDESVVHDDKVITSRGPGTAMDFALHLIEVLVGKAQRDSVEARLQRPPSAA